jgi:hypothetical protein
LLLNRRADSSLFEIYSFAMNVSLLNPMSLKIRNS